MIRKKLLNTKTFRVCLLAGAATFGLNLVATTDANAANMPMRSATEIVDAMGLGWNLGNSLDAHESWATDPTDSETSWGNPVTTRAMIDKVKEGGFNTIRIPVTWQEHIGAAPEYKVDEAWMNRVQEVVDYAMDAGMYVVLNTHHDDWILPYYAVEDETTEKIEKLWAQIADRFKDYNDRLIFEAFNEVRAIGTEFEWNGGSDEGREVVNHYNEAAVEVIRKSGGNNDERSIMLQTYAGACNDNAIQSLTIPDTKNIIGQIHAYSPYNFSMNCYDEFQTDKWGTQADRDSLKWEMEHYYQAFKAKGVPLVIGEMGTTNKNNLHDRVELTKEFVKLTKERGIKCIVWDNGQNGIGAENFGLFDRNNLNWYHPEIRNAFVNSYNSTPYKFK